MQNATESLRAKWSVLNLLVVVTLCSAGCAAAGTSALDQSEKGDEDDPGFTVVVTPPAALVIPEGQRLYRRITFLGESDMARTSTCGSKEKYRASFYAADPPEQISIEFALSDPPPADAPWDSICGTMEPWTLDTRWELSVILDRDELLDPEEDIAALPTERDVSEDGSEFFRLLYLDCDGTDPATLSCVRARD